MNKPQKYEDKNIIYYEDDEIDLFELLLVLKKRWWLIILSTLLFLGLGISIILMSKKLYKSEYIIKSIQIDGKNPVNINEIISWINSKYTAKNNDQIEEYLRKHNSYLKEVKQVKNLKGAEGSNMILLTIIGTDNNYNEKLFQIILKEAVDYYTPFIEDFKIKTLGEIENLKITIDGLINFEIPRIKNQINLINNEEVPSLEKELNLNLKKLENLDNLIKNYSKSIQSYEETVKNLSAVLKNKGISDSTKLLILSQIAQYEQLINKLRSEITKKEMEKNKIINKTIPELQKRIKELKTVKVKSLENRLTDLNRKVTELQYQLKSLNLKLRPPFTYNFKHIETVKSSKPYKPKKKLILLTSIVVGITIGIFLAFFIEWIKNRRLRENI